MKYSLLPVAAVVFALFPAFASGQAVFRVDTDVRFGPKNVSVVQSRTVFAKSGFVYDFQSTGNKEIVIFDTTNRMITVIDPTREIVTTISENSILETIARLRAKLPKNEAAQRFPVTFPRKDRVVVDGQRLVYQADGFPPKFDNAALQYRHFADWSIRINAFRQGNPPPFARLTLNEELAKKKLIPVNVERDVKANPAQRARSAHTLLWQLTPKDHKSIEQAHQFAKKFRNVTPPQYFTQLFAQKK